MEDQKPQTDQKRVTTLKALNLATEFGFIIALPIVAFGLLGKYLDRHFHTKYFVLVGILLAIVSSVIWLYNRMKSILRDLRKP